MSLRGGGASVAPWDSFNLGVAVGDNPAHVSANRSRFASALGATPLWLRQVHGSQVLRLRGDEDSTHLPPADAAWTTEAGVACTVQVADCLPVLFCATDGRAVAAAHAGWRGLAGGVLEATLQALHQGAGVPAAQVLAWLGPCIGPRQFEVGADVLLALGHDPADPDAERFAPRARPDGSPRWLANLPLLARDRLQAAGVARITTAGECTVEAESRFFSFRRSGVTGRMAAAVWRR